MDSNFLLSSLQAEIYHSTFFHYITIANFSLVSSLEGEVMLSRQEVMFTSETLYVYASCITEAQMCIGKKELYGFIETCFYYKIFPNPCIVTEWFLTSWHIEEPNLCGIF